MSVLMRIKLLPGSFTYEKYFSGKYLGDLTRIILASCLTEIGETLADDFVITTSDVSDVIRYCCPNPEILLFPPQVRGGKCAEGVEPHAVRHPDLHRRGEKEVSDILTPESPRC